MPTQPAEDSIAALQTRPGRTVFTDSANPDAWIATSLTVDIEH